MNREEFLDILKKAVEVKSSDLHFTAGEVPAFRIDGKIQKSKLDVLTEEDIIGFIDITAPEEIKKNVLENNDSDYPYEIKDFARFRINIAKSFGKHSMTVRVISWEIPTLEMLQLPSSLKNFTKHRNGIVLITGSAGSGKSTTIASLLEYINTTLKKHIVTIEDPVEYVYTNKKCIFTQRQVGIDTVSFKSGIKYALRQDPDVILIGEIRDAETVRSALYAAETGHFVYATLHTYNAVQTINRLLSFFEPNEREIVRRQFAEVFRGSISQMLLPYKSGQGRIPAVEVLFSTPTIKDFIIKNELEEIYKLVKKGAYNDMITFNQSLYDLLKRGIISQETALNSSDAPDELRRYIRGVYSS